jgi:hypothetical protein
MLVIGGGALTREDSYAEIAARAGGDLARIHRAADALRVIAKRSLPALERIDIVSLTTQQPARGVRVLPDGRFDGFVPLEPGANEIDVRATLADGTSVRAVRTLTCAPAADGEVTAEQLAEARRITIELEARASEVRLRSAAAQGAERAESLRAGAAVAVPAPAGAPLTEQEVIERTRATERASRGEDRSVAIEASTTREPGGRDPEPAPRHEPRGASGRYAVNGSVSRERAPTGGTSRSLSAGRPALASAHGARAAKLAHVFASSRSSAVQSAGEAHFAR